MIQIIEPNNSNTMQQTPAVQTQPAMQPGCGCRSGLTASGKMVALLLFALLVLLVLNQVKQLRA